MIRDTIEIQCDKCGRHEQIQRMILYRISRLMSSFIEELEIAGWKFIRDEEYQLKKVLCPHCNIDGKPDVHFSTKVIGKKW